jgi:signal transduction histidine kinase
MELDAALLHLYDSDDPSGAFCALARALTPTLPLRSALYIQSPGRVVRDCWPTPVSLTDDLIDTVQHVLRPEVFPLGSEFPFDATRFPGAEMLVLPVRRGGERRAVCVFVADEDSFGEDLQPWSRVARAIEHFEARHERVAEAEARCAELQQRVEESEALHTLGLAANRTLDMKEVLDLVAPFTRTLLGAHYVTVNTADGGMIYNVASVGLRHGDAAQADYQLARMVVEAEKPLTVGGPAPALRVEDFPFHAAEGMKVGLGIPLSLFGDTFGALLVGYRRPYEISPRDIRLGLTLAGHAAVAISNARLHATVGERSRQLQSAYEELDALAQAKERFFASINHELRNPVGAVVNYVELVLDGVGGEIPPAAHGYLEKARRAGQTLRTLINDILDLSKLAAGKMEVNLRPCAIPEIVDGVLNTIQPLADQNGVPVQVELPPDLPPLTTDGDRVQQILVNLASNAVKFTGAGGVRLRAVSVAAEPGSDGDCDAAVEFRVADDGPGIGPDDRKRIFEEYEQVKGTKGGTGLGLPISRRLARALGGELWVESEVGVGSEFVLRVPAPRAAGRESEVSE